VTFAGIICAIMGARDNPAAGAVNFLRMTVVGACIAGLYLFLVLPTLASFPALAIALAPFYLTCGLFLTSPRTAPLVMPVIFGAGGLISISNQMTYDFAAFLNSALGYVIGIAMGVTALALLRPFGRDVTMVRLSRGMLHDLARLAGSAASETRSSFESRMFDRINALLAQLDPAQPSHRQAIQASLATLRLGLNVLVLKRERPRMTPSVGSAVDRALAGLSAGLWAASSQRRAASPEPLFEAARQIVLSAADQPLIIADALYGIETTLEQHADFFLADQRSHPPTLIEAAAE
jgi:uncharacterized membrane protein YccC